MSLIRQSPTPVVDAVLAVVCVLAREGRKRLPIVNLFSLLHPTGRERSIPIVLRLLQPREALFLFLPHFDSCLMFIHS